MVDSNADTLLKSKATPQNKETIEENPYNQKKNYIDYEQEEANKKETFQDANSIAVKKDQPKVVVDSMQSLDEPQEDTPEKTEDKPYSKVDYKKRYDALKKHYDGRVKKLNTSINKEKAEAKLARLHPDFTEIRESDAFHGWAESQPEEIKGWIYSNNSNAELASRAIDLFKQDTGKSKSKVETGDLVDASQMVKVKNTKEVGYGSKKIWTRSQIAAMSQSEFDKNEKAITEAMTDGRVINDMGNRPSRGSGNPTS